MIALNYRGTLCVIQMVTFVTALVKLPGQFRPMDVYCRLFDQLVATGIPLRVYLDESLRAYGDSLTAPNVRVVEYVTCRPPWAVQLPRERHPTKDTVEYMQVQLRKLEFLVDACQHTDDEFLAWIDFGILHMAEDLARWTQQLQTIARSQFPRDRLLAPGSWPPGSYSVWDRVCWRFCGSFVLGHRSLLRPAFERQCELVVSGLPRITWEINYWSQMEEFFQVYRADHNDTLLEGLLEWTEPKSDETPQSTEQHLPEDAQTQSRPSE
jgi:hypothetical protein